MLPYRRQHVHDGNCFERNLSIDRGIAGTTGRLETTGGDGQCQRHHIAYDRLGTALDPVGRRRETSTASPQELNATDCLRQRSTFTLIAADRGRPHFEPDHRQLSFPGAAAATWAGT
jgi:hypothetical protein